MVHTCYAYGCKSRGAGIGFFRFPKDKKLRKRWQEATKRIDFEPSKNSRLCIVHFAPDAFETGGLRRRLKPGAMPTIFQFPWKKNEEPKKTRRILIRNQMETQNFSGNDHIPESLKVSKQESKDGLECNVSNISSPTQSRPTCHPPETPHACNAMETQNFCGSDQVPQSLKVSKQESKDGLECNVSNVSSPTQSRPTSRMTGHPPETPHTCNAMEKLSFDNKMLRRKVKILMQRLKRRDKRVKNLKISLAKIKKVRVCCLRDFCVHFQQTMKEDSKQFKTTEPESCETEASESSIEFCDHFLQVKEELNQIETEESEPCEPKHSESNENETSLEGCKNFQEIIEENLEQITSIESEPCERKSSEVSFAFCGNFQEIVKEEPNLIETEESESCGPEYLESNENGASLEPCKHFQKTMKEKLKQIITIESEPCKPQN